MILLGVGVAIELILFSVLWQTGKYWALYSMIIVAVLLAGLSALERYVVTPAEAVRSTLYAMADAAEQNDVDAVIAHVSRRAPELKSRARQLLEPVKLDEVKIKRIYDLQVRPEGPPPSAVVHFKVLAVGGDRAGTITNFRALREFEVIFVLEDNQWRLRAYKQQDSGPLSP